MTTTTNFQKNQAPFSSAAFPQLMSDREMLEHYAQLSDKAAKRVQFIFSHENEFIDLLEKMQTIKNWRQIRASLTVIDEYVDFLNTSAKHIALPYLLQMLSHENGTVRRVAARTCGHLLAKCDLTDSDAWSNFLHKILFPGSEVSEQHKRWMGYALKIVLFSILEKAEEKQRKAAFNIYVSYFKSTRWDTLTCLTLINGITDLSHSDWSNQQRYYILGFLRQLLSKDNAEIRIASQWLLYQWLKQGWKPSEEMRHFLENLSVKSDACSCEGFLILHIHTMLDPAASRPEEEKFANVSMYHLMQENLHTQSSWLHKIINLLRMKESFGTDAFPLSQYASHLLTMLRFSNQAVVFLQAGEDLVELMPYLEAEQKYSIVQEIFKALELGDDSSNYLPAFLGKTFLYLSLEEQTELLPHMKQLMNSQNTDIVNTTLEVVTVILQNYTSFIANHEERAWMFQEEIQTLVGLLYRGMASSVPAVAREAFFLVAHQLFAENLSKRSHDPYCLLYTSPSPRDCS